MEPQCSFQAQDNLSSHHHESIFNVLAANNQHFKSLTDLQSLIYPCNQFSLQQNHHQNSKQERIQIEHPHLFVGSTILFGKCRAGKIDFSGEQVQLKIYHGYKTTLGLEDEHSQFKVTVEVMFASYLAEVIKLKIGHFKFFYSQDLDSIQKKEVLTHPNNYDHIIPIRMDVYLLEGIFNGNIMKNMSQNEEDPKCKDSLCRHLLIYLIKKCQVQVITNSLVVPPPKLNYLMRSFRTETIGHKMNSFRNQSRLNDKVQRWKGVLERCQIFQCCISQRQYYNHEPSSYLDQYYQGTKFISWDKKQEEIERLIIIEKGREKIHQGYEKSLTEEEKQSLQEIKYKNLREIGADIFIRNQIKQVIKGPCIQIDAQSQNQNGSKEVEQQDIGQQLNRKNNMQLLQRFQLENRCFVLHPTPPVMLTRLKDYQCQALQWMKIREGKISEALLFQSQYSYRNQHSDFERKLSIFWQELKLPGGTHFYMNPLTAQFSKQHTSRNRIKGGILADEMGLGKTLMILSLIADQNYQGTNIVVLPVAVLNQWMKQIETHCGKQVKVLNFNQLKKEERVRARIHEYNFVLVTYATLASEYKIYKQGLNRKDRSIFDQNFRRIILDQAHQIRQSTTLQFQAVLQIKAQYKWCLTGTLVQNSEKDLFSILKFLKIEFFSEEKWWNQYIKNAPSFQGKLKILYTILRPILLRRTKQTIDLGIPNKEENIVKPEFTEEQRKIYKILETGAIAEITNQDNQNNYVFAFSIINKLRQFCCHPKLVLGNINIGDLEQKTNQEIMRQFFTSKVTEEYNKTTLQNAIEGSQQCVICFEQPQIQVLTVTSCGHIFCQNCIKTQIELNSKCPNCRAYLTLKQIFKPNETEQKKEQMRHRKKIINHVKQNSTKMTVIIELAKKFKNKGQKGIIFTQWLSMIQLLQNTFQEQEIGFSVIKGSMTAIRRQKQIERFKSQQSCSILIVSFRAGSCGINLQVANNVIISDPWWNPCLEDQAIGRVHRLGQERKVNVYKLYMRGSIEQKIEELHKKKRLISHQIMMNKQSLKQKNVTLLSQLIQMMRVQQIGMKG